MCFSAMVRQNLKKLSLDLNARIQLDLFKDLFERRLSGENLPVAPALEAYFINSEEPSEREIGNLIQKHRALQLTESEKELFETKRRLDEATKKFENKATKTAEKEIGVAERKLARIQSNIKELQHPPDATDGRIWAKYYAPVVIEENGQRVIRPMRYLCRPAGKPADFDTKFSGCYNARLDNLAYFWKQQFGSKHAILVITEFFENVRDAEGKNIVLAFKPQGVSELFIPCVWDHWTGPGSHDLDSFALITRDPTPEILAAGHERCPVPLSPSALEAWLDTSEPKSHLDVLEDIQQLFFENRLLA